MENALRREIPWAPQPSQERERGCHGSPKGRTARKWSAHPAHFNPLSQAGPFLAVTERSLFRQLSNVFLQTDLRKASKVRAQSSGSGAEWKRTFAEGQNLSHSRPAKMHSAASARAQDRAGNRQLLVKGDLRISSPLWLPKPYPNNTLQVSSLLFTENHKGYVFQAWTRGGRLKWAGDGKAQCNSNGPSCFPALRHTRPL